MNPAVAALGVAGCGVASAALGALANALAGGGPSGAYVAAALPLLFLVFWLLQAYCVDAAAGMVGRSGRRRELLLATAPTFPAWILYALLGLAEALAIHLAAGSTGQSVASGLQWLTLPILALLLALTVMAIRGVYRVSGLNAFAFALLPYAMLTAAILVLSLVLSGLHAAGVV
ncbi:MAG: hypothetical protein JOZ92_05830 [Candidatus Dormibacteraeota bacterium]|nr:hypothetical protein [Candidatus Dormibacteraeota bacterium]